MSDDKLNLILDKLTSIEGRQNNIEQGIINIGTRLEAVESNQMLAKTGIENLGKRLDTFESDLEALDAHLSEELRATVGLLREISVGLRTLMSEGFAIIEKKIDILAKDTLRVRANQELLEDRIDKLESKPS